MFTDQTNQEEKETINPEEQPRRIQTAEGWKRSMLKRKLSEKNGEKNSVKSKDKKNAA